MNQRLALTIPSVFPLANLASRMLQWIVYHWISPSSLTRGMNGFRKAGPRPSELGNGIHPKPTATFPRCRPELPGDGIARRHHAALHAFLSTVFLSPHGRQGRQDPDARFRQ